MLMEQYVCLLPGQYRISLTVSCRVLPSACRVKNMNPKIARNTCWSAQYSGNYNTIFDMYYKRHRIVRGVENSRRRQYIADGKYWRKYERGLVSCYSKGIYRKWIAVSA